MVYPLGDAKKNQARAYKNVSAFFFLVLVYY